jgi:hypothetical protein
LLHVGVGDPRRDAFARPVMRVVHMHDQRAQRQLLLTAFGIPPPPPPPVAEVTMRITTFAGTYCWLSNFHLTCRSSPAQGLLENGGDFQIDPRYPESAVLTFRPDSEHDRFWEVPIAPEKQSYFIAFVA